ncbi:glycosyltransferase family 2 protein [Baekduia soli]|uniref:glycosyltransferase family 2 protein n=1 Tax=Baekduia soli TaxID=496014 RepID=UPI0016528D27|nr:glycosyltransferase family 2 protein [Baekduia soli]
MHHPVVVHPIDPEPTDALGPEPTDALAGTGDGLRRAPGVLPGLTVVLPCFNEADNVADAIRAATRAAQRCAMEHEIVVVDDGSSDETAAIAARFATRDRRVRLVVHSHNQGYGDAVRTGIGAARMPWVLLTDADLQFDLGELETFLPAAARADLVVGWRILRQDPVNRRVNAAAWNWLVRHVFDLPVRDVDCAFKLIRTDLLRRFELRSGGAMISTELLVRCLGAGARLEQLGVHHRPRVAGEQSGASPRVVARAFRELGTLRRDLRAARAAG